MKTLAILLLAAIAAFSQYSRAIDPFPHVITEQGVREAVDIAAAAGSKHLHIVPLWNEFETAPGVYDYYSVDILAGHAKRLGLGVYLNFRVIDTNRSAIPTFYSHYKINSPILRVRLNNALDALHARLATHGVQIKWLGVGNEIDGFLTSAALVNEYRTLFVSARSRMKQLWPSAPVGFSLQSWANMQLFAPLASAADYLAFTYYPILPNFTVSTPVDGAAVFNTMATLANYGKPVFWQEIGFPSSAQCNSSQQDQAEFVYWATAILDYFAANGLPPLGATLYTLHDFPPDFVAYLAQYYGVDGPEFAAFLGSLGLIDQQGAPKAAWPVAADWLRRP